MTVKHYYRTPEDTLIDATTLIPEPVIECDGVNCPGSFPAIHEFQLFYQDLSKTGTEKRVSTHFCQDCFASVRQALSKVLS